MGYIRKLNDSVNIIGTNLRKYRIQNNYSQEDLCKKLALLGLTMFFTGHNCSFPASMT